MKKDQGIVMMRPKPMHSQRFSEKEYARLKLVFSTTTHACDADHIFPPDFVLEEAVIKITRSIDEDDAPGGQTTDAALGKSGENSSNEATLL